MEKLLEQALPKEAAEMVKKFIDKLGDNKFVSITYENRDVPPLYIERLSRAPKDMNDMTGFEILSFGEPMNENGKTKYAFDVHVLYKEAGAPGLGINYPIVIPYFFANNKQGDKIWTLGINPQGNVTTYHPERQFPVTSFFVSWLNHLNDLNTTEVISPITYAAGGTALPHEDTGGSTVLENDTTSGPEINPTFMATDLKGNPKKTWMLSEDEFKSMFSVPGIGKAYKSIDGKKITVIDRVGNAGLAAIWEVDIDGKKEELTTQELRQKVYGDLKEHTFSTREAYVEQALNDGEITQAMNNGEISAADAMEIIESAGLEIPDGFGPPSSIEAQTATADTILEAESAPESHPDWLIGDNYFASHPENVLGEPYTSSGRFGPVTKYRGTIDDIDRIQAPTDFRKPFDLENNPLISQIAPGINEMANSAEGIANAKNAIKKSRKSMVKKINAMQEPQAAGDLDLQSIDEIYNLYNPEITDEELFAFIWYRDSIGYRLSQHWYDLSFRKGNDIDTMYSDVTLKSWVESGALCYYGGSDVKKGSTNLVPAYLYLAENIWKKEAQLKRDKEEIIAAYGQEVYDKQYARLHEVFKAKYDKRLTIKGSGADDGLILIPVSDFAKKFMIKTLNDEDPFKFKKVTAASSKAYGKPDFLSTDFLPTGYYRDKAADFDELSLTDAFCVWLVKDKTIEFKKGTNYREIISIYVFQAQKPRYESTVDDKLGRAAEDAQWERQKARAKVEGDHLFAEFLNTQLTLNDRIRLETEWNGTFNSYVPLNFNKVPVLFECARYFRNEFVDIRPEKREAAADAFSEGSVCLAYDTGVGKTFSSIFAIAQFMYAGYAKRPLVVVPNSVYKQFMKEIHGLLPQFGLMGLYNMSEAYLDNLRDEAGNIKKIPENTIAIMTYEGFRNIGFNDDTSADILNELYAILNQGGIDEYLSQKKSEKKEAGFREKLEGIIGRGLRGTKINIEDLGVDYFTFDEAHKMKKVFTVVKAGAKEGEEEKSGKREKARYDIQSGQPSSIALKGFMLAYYIQKENHWQNICLLTATPFTNSPLEIFSMLAFLGYKKLQDDGLNNLQAFFDTYIDVSYELTINSRLEPERKQVIRGFRNLISLQTLIRRFINYKGEKDVFANKPNKIVLPLLYKKVGDQVIQLGPNERIETNLELSVEQSMMMDDIKEYVGSGKGFAEGGITYADGGDIEAAVEEEGGGSEATATEGTALDYGSLDDDEKLAVRILKGMSWSRALALSPYLYANSGLGTPTYLEYIETSPKLSYVIECIRSVKDWHEANGTPVSGQIIYMDRGIEYFKLIKEYLVKEVGYKDHEVQSVFSGLPKSGPRSKSGIQDAFLGQKWNETTMEYDDIPDSERVKVVIGSGTIREGMNLQRYSTVLYNCFVDWNPTDEKQLDGRIHRQGNMFNNVRIVIPLMIDSMDIFIFQKLEEKTARINTIWSMDGRENVLKLEDFNPRDLKNSLIKDPRVLAELNIKEALEGIQDEIGSFNSEKSRLDNIEEYSKTIDDHLDTAKEWIKAYREVKKFDPDTKPWEKAKFFVDQIKAFLKKPTDKDGARIFDFPTWNNDYEDEIAPLIKKGVKVNRTIKPNHWDMQEPHWLKDFNLAQRQLNKENEAFLIPKGIKLNKLDSYRKTLDKRIKELEARSKDMESKENINKLADEIRAERKKSNYHIGKVSERVQQFKTLNHLLGDRKIIQTPAPMTSTPDKPIDGLKGQFKSLINLLREKYARGGGLFGLFSIPSYGPQTSLYRAIYSSNDGHGVGIPAGLVSGAFGEKNEAIDKKVAEENAWKLAKEKGYEQKPGYRVDLQKMATGGGVKGQVYTYHINLDERGEFYADVRDASGKTVFEIKELGIFEDGFMKNKQDLSGLKEYLVDLEIMDEDDHLVNGHDYALGGGIPKTKAELEAILKELCNTPMLDDLTLPNYILAFYKSLKKSDVSAFTWAVTGKGFVPNDCRKIREFFWAVYCAYSPSAENTQSANNYLKDIGFNMNLVEKSDFHRIFFKDGRFLNIVVPDYRNDDRMLAGTQFSQANYVEKNLLAPAVASGLITQEESKNLYEKGLMGRDKKDAGGKVYDFSKGAILKANQDMTFLGIEKDQVIAVINNGNNLEIGPLSWSQEQLAEEINDGIWTLEKEL